MKIWTHATPSHYPLLDLLQKSMARLSLGLPKVAMSTTQAEGNGAYLSGGWNMAMASKAHTVLNAINAGDTFMFLDADVVLLKNPFPDADRYLDANNIDIALARDDNDGSACPGMMIVRGGDTKVRRLYRQIIRDLESGSVMCEQPQVNLHLRAGGIRWGYLPDTYANPVMRKGRPYKDLVAFHANWTIGVKDKKELLEQALAHL